MVCFLKGYTAYIFIWRLAYLEELFRGSKVIDSEETMQRANSCMQHQSPVNMPTWGSHWIFVGMMGFSWALAEHYGAHVGLWYISMGKFSRVGTTRVPWPNLHEAHENKFYQVVPTMASSGIQMFAHMDPMWALERWYYVILYMLPCPSGIWAKNSQNCLKTSGIHIFRC